jgi:hypothetical protein
LSGAENRGGILLAAAGPLARQGQHDILSRDTLGVENAL